MILETQNVKIFTMLRVSPDITYESWKKSNQFSANIAQHLKQLKILAKQYNTYQNSEVLENQKNNKCFLFSAYAAKM